MISASDKLYLKTLGQRPRTFIDITNTNESRLEKMAFLGSPVRLTSRRPSSTPRVCTDGVRSLLRWRHNQIFSAWWVTNFITHDALLARFARTCSAKATNAHFSSIWVLLLTSPHLREVNHYNISVCSSQAEWAWHLVLFVDPSVKVLQSQASQSNLHFFQIFRVLL